jgi:aerobic-type carbon monoxide dehydrogenase small subunit (CoxS/CutS family)
MSDTITFTLNGEPVRLTTGGDRPLLWVLRADLGMTGTKFGCGEGLCGSCTVLVDGKPIRSCQTDAKNVTGKEVVTIEGLARNGDLHPLQKAFVDHDALQCGFCTPGMIMNAYGLLLENPRPNRSEIVESMDDNLCRCGSYGRIIEAIQAASREMKGR